MGIDKSLLNQDPSQAVTHENQGPIWVVLAFNPNSFKKFVRYICEGALTFAIGRRGIIFVEKNACFGNLAG